MAEIKHLKQIADDVSSIRLDSNQIAPLVVGIAAILTPAVIQQVIDDIHALREALVAPPVVGIEVEPGTPTTRP